MKVTKFSSQIQSSVSSDNFSASSSLMPSDAFFNLISQMADKNETQNHIDAVSDSTPAVSSTAEIDNANKELTITEKKSGDIDSQPVSTKDANASTSTAKKPTSEESANNEDDAKIAYLQLTDSMSEINNKDLLDAVTASSETKTVLPMDVAVNNNMANLISDNAMIQPVITTTENNPIPQQDDVDVQNQIVMTSPVVESLNQTATLKNTPDTTVEADPISVVNTTTINLPEVAHSSPQFSQQSFSNNQQDDQTDLLDELTQPVDAPSAKANTTAPEPSSKIAPAQVAEIALASQASAQSMLQAPSDLAATAFTQLSQFINERTAQYAPAAAFPTPAAVQDTYTTMVQNNSLIDVTEKVELLPPTMDSMMRETFNANIKIYPPDLGPVFAKLRMDKGNAELVILTDSVRVKEIVESQLPNLRQSFQNSELNLTHVKVETMGLDAKSQNNQQQQQQKNTDQSSLQQFNNGLTSSIEKMDNSPKESHTLIDTYA